MSMVAKLKSALLGLVFTGLACAHAALAQDKPNSIEKLEASQQGGNVIIRFSMKEPLSAAPATFSIAKPARIAFDFPATASALGNNAVTFNLGELRNANIIQVADRTRVVLNLNAMQNFDSKIEGNDLLVTLQAQAKSTTRNESLVAHFSEAKAADNPHVLKNVNFRKGKDGEGRVVVDLSDGNTGIDIRQQGQSLVVDFLNASIAEELRRRMDVTDFGTAVTSINVLRQGSNVRLIVTPKGLWEHNAYQSDNQFVLEVKRLVEDPNKLVQGTRGGYKGEKLSLNFQNVDVRNVLSVIADFTNFNIITSDTVNGSLTLRLKDVPWDQALDIILQAKGLDMRKNGNVIWIAPRDELAAKEKLELESRQQISELEQTHSESFQLNYQKADVVYKFLSDKNQTLLSKQGRVIVDTRTNKIFITDTSSRLDEIRQLLKEIDIPTRQVLIEARIVEASDTFQSSLGVRLGGNIFAGKTVTLTDSTGKALTRADGTPLTISQYTGGTGGLASTGYSAGQISTTPDYFKNLLGVNLPASSISGTQPGQFSFALYNSNFSRFLDLEISALEADGKGKVVSSPRVLTANQVEALIEQGVEIPYQQATSSGATSISFRKANLSLKVKPQITPDGAIMMQLDINKDTPNTLISTGSGIAIDTKHVKTEALVENGGTVVIGGIYTREETTTVSKIPLLGDIPYLGFLFRSKDTKDNKTELLIFITPKIVTENLTLR